MKNNTKEPLCRKSRGILQCDSPLLPSQETTERTVVRVHQSNKNGLNTRNGSISACLCNFNGSRRCMCRGMGRGVGVVVVSPVRVDIRGGDGESTGEEDGNGGNSKLHFDV